MDIEVRTNWLFPKDLEASGQLFEVSDVMKHTNKDGKEGGLKLLLLGKNKFGAGDFFCFLSSIMNLGDLVKAYSKDSEKWKLKKFTLIPLDEKKFKAVI